MINMKRNRLLAGITAAVAAGDERTALRIHLEHRSISRAAYLEARERGLRLASPPSPPPPPPSAPDMVRCPHCGNLTRAGYSRCGPCLRPLELA